MLINFVILTYHTEHNRVFILHCHTERSEVSKGQNALSSSKIDLKKTCFISKQSHLFQKLSHYRAFNASKIHAYLALVRAHNSPYTKDFMLYQIALF